MAYNKFKASALGALLLTLNFGAANAAETSPMPEMVDEDVVIMSHWSVKLPFSMDGNDPLMVGEVLDPTSEWIAPGRYIKSVNGIEIGNLNAVRAVLRMSTDLVDQTDLKVRFGTALGEELATLPVIQDTVLKNGLHFETIFEGDAWVSTLVTRPESAATDLQVGDRLVSYNGQLFDQRKSVQQVFQKERRKGMMSYSVVFERGDQTLTGMIELMNDEAEEELNLVALPQRDTANLVVLTQWNVQLPMQADPSAPARVERADRTTRLNAGDQIVSVNGIDVAAINALSPVLRLSTEIEDQTELDVEVGVMHVGEENVSLERMSLPIVQDTVLSNGMRFETTYAKNSWETYLVTMPDASNTDLKVGDRILAYGNGTPINARTSFKDIIEMYRRQGMQHYEVVVLRDGEFMRCKLYF